MRPTPGRRIRLVLLLTLMGLANACVSASTCEGEPGITTTSGESAIERGLTNVGPVTWARADATEDGCLVLIRYRARTLDCAGLADLTLERDDDVWTLTLYEGIRPPNQACTNLRSSRDLQLRVSEPITGRLVDGAA